MITNSNVPTSIVNVCRQIGVKYDQLSDLPIADITRATESCYSTAPDGRVIGLCLAGLGIETVPQSVFELHKLEILRLFDNRISQLDEQLLQLRNLRSLYLSDNWFSRAPSLISELENLEVLALNGNQLEYLPSEFSQLRSLKRLGLSSNPLRNVPDFLQEAVALEGLFLDQTGVRTVPDWLYELPKLNELGLSDLGLTYLGRIERARGLERLHIRAVKLKRLPTEFWALANLKVLDLSHSLVEEIPSDIQRLQRLEELDLTSTRLTTLPREIGNLSNLRALQIAAVDPNIQLPAELASLECLTELNLSGLRLRTIPSMVFSQSSLEALDLSGTALTSVPKEIFSLPNLKALNLSANRIRRVPPAVIEYGWTCEWDTTIAKRSCQLKGNPLESPPPEIVAEGSDALTAYFRSVEAGTLPINEVKILLVGDGGAGKTSFAKRILGEEFDDVEPQTHGINIDDWEFEFRKEADSGMELMRARLWDFGGQEIMHATHQFFLSRRSVYLLLLDSRKDERAEYWLQHVRTYGGDSPVLVIINKIDENPGFDLNRRFLREKYPNIVGFYRVSCRTSVGVSKVISKLQRILLSLKHARTAWSESWFAVKEALEHSEHDYISATNFRSICVREGISELVHQETLMRLLHDLGIALRFDELPLRETSVINPKWLTEGVYAIINSVGLARSGGLLNLESLTQALCTESHPPDTHNFIIEIMKKFELCYAVAPNEVLVPSLLPVEEPAVRRSDGPELAFLLVYEFLPKSVIARFIVRMHSDIVDTLRWRTGVALKSAIGSARAFVRTDEERRRIEISIHGENRRDYLAVIVHAFRTINTTFRRLRAEERVSLPDARTLSVSLEHLFYLESRGVRTLIPEGATREYEVSELLGEVRGAQQAESEALNILRELKKRGDTEETLLSRVNEAALLQPNLFGIGINLNALIRRLFARDE